MVKFRMKILGIHDGHDAGACLVEDGLVTKAVSEERLTRRKHQRGVPKRAIAYCLHENNEVDAVTIAGLSRRLKRQRQLTQTIKDLDLVNTPTLSYEHHYCHQMSTFFTSGWDEATVLSADAGGDGRSLVFSIAEGPNIHQLGTCSIYDSLGDLYSTITEFIGFKKMDQEGKTMALAALGHPQIASAALDKVIALNSSQLNFSGNSRFLGTDGRNQLKTKLNKFAKEDLAAGIQAKLERDILDLINKILSITKSSRLCLAGGIFANTVLNHKIRQLKAVKELWIFPAMGDAGLCVGAALAAYTDLSNSINDFHTPPRIRSVYLGPDLGTMTPSKTRVQEVCDRLEEGKLVGLVHGRAEFGPRALGHRSLIALPFNMQIKDEINRRKGRHLFQPLAPALLEEDGSDLLHNHERSPFMTICFDATEKMKSTSPVIIHLDGTSRPQTVGSNDDPLFREILLEIKQRWDLGILVNTSLNLHGSPIVQSTEDAKECLQRGLIDELVIPTFV